MFILSGYASVWDSSLDDIKYWPENIWFNVGRSFISRVILLNALIGLNLLRNVRRVKYYKGFVAVRRCCCHLQHSCNAKYAPLFSTVLHESQDNSDFYDKWYLTSYRYFLNSVFSMSWIDIIVGECVDIDKVKDTDCSSLRKIRIKTETKVHVFLRGVITELNSSLFFSTGYSVAESWYKK